MRKEILAAAAVGILFGVIVGFGFWKFNRDVQTKTLVEAKVSESVYSSSKPEPTPSENASIILDTPYDNQSFIESKVLVSGVTKANTIVVVSDETKDSIISSSDNGVFNADIELSDGLNVISITSLNDQVQTKKTLTLAKSSFLTYAPDLDALVVEGTILDKTEASLQLSDTKGSIQFLTIDPEKTRLTRDDNGVRKPFSYEELAIGDTIAGVGIQQKNGVLLTNEIIVGDVPLDNRIIEIATIVATGRNTITLVDTNKTRVNAALSSTTNITDNQFNSVPVSRLLAGQSVIVTGIKTKSGITARAIHIR